MGSLQNFGKLKTSTLLICSEYSLEVTDLVAIISKIKFKNNLIVK